ncbi:hypothetical protein ATANTOWER_029460 [Ataeniobius toweri]|uniref:Secreted protein n=1 Tax=Ataeniobius toweri TaxID=208326 RepID=A0ABU7CN13_9TELE|nr:hypothetical protein [Ataeniobius toweri]
MCSFLYFRLKKWFRVHLLCCLSLLDEASKGAITINVSLSFPIESTPGSVLLYSFSVSALFSQTPSQSWQMAAHTEPGSAGGFFLLKANFPLHCRYIHAQYEGLPQSQCKPLSLHAHPGGVNAASH